VALVRPLQLTFELGCAAQVFGARWPGLPVRYGFGVCAERPGPVSHREGGQLQYAAPAHPVQIDGSLAPLLEWVTGRLAEPLSVQDMAAHAGVSARTLARRFADQLGVGPGQWLLAQRLSAARELLESSDLPLDAVARRVGLSSSTNLRRRFVRALGTTPGAYRRAFHARTR
jgi:AraC family transcriptional activator FtrA